MPEIEEDKTINEIADLLEKLVLKDEDFKGRTAEVTPVHSMIINEIGKKWSEDKGLFVEKFTEYAIDFIGRERNFDRIILAVEVDRGHRAMRSWSKLADIRAKNKVWVYVTDRPISQAERRFKDASNNVRRFLDFRAEDVFSFGKFAVILKTPKHFKVEWILK